MHVSDLIRLIWICIICKWCAVLGWRGVICSTSSCVRLARLIWSQTTGLRTPSDDLVRSFVRCHILLRSWGWFYDLCVCFSSTLYLCVLCLLSLSLLFYLIYGLVLEINYWWLMMMMMIFVTQLIRSVFFWRSCLSSVLFMLFVSFANYGPVRDRTDRQTGVRTGKMHNAAYIGRPRCTGVA